jgi:phospholipid transport system substrate-binding protein
MRRSIPKLLSVLLAVAALGGVPSRAFAGEAQNFIQSRQAQVATLLHQPDGPGRDTRIASVLDSMLDYDALAQRSLAEHWGELSEAQRKDFTELLKKLVQRNYERSIKSILNYSVDYLGEEPGSEGVVVHTRASSKTNQREEPITIDYRLGKVGDAWRVFDIITEGSSLVDNYKHQFHRVIKKDGYESLVRRMKEKLAKGQTGI